MQEARPGIIGCRMHLFLLFPKDPLPGSTITWNLYTVFRFECPHLDDSDISADIILVKVYIAVIRAAVREAAEGLVEAALTHTV